MFIFLQAKPSQGKHSMHCVNTRVALADVSVCRGTDVFTFQHGALAYDMREVFEAGDLDEDIQRLQGPKAASLFKRNDVCII